MKELLQRFVPKNWWNQIEFCLDTDQVTKDYLSLDMPRKNYLIIKGNNKVSLASGLYYYLTNYCHYHVTWD